MPKPKSVDDINVRFTVTLSLSMTLGVYDGPITRQAIAENVAAMFEAAGGPEEFIDSVHVDEITTDDGTSIIASGEPSR